MGKDNTSYKTFGKEGELSNSSDKDFFNETDLKNVKDGVLRLKCESAFDSLAISKGEFYRRAKISPQYWWRLTWGYDSFPLWLKKHLFREFGDCFAFLFSYELIKEEGEL